MMQALELLRLAKGMSWAEATLTSEEINPLAIAIIKLRFSEDINKLLEWLKKKIFEQGIGIAEKSLRDRWGGNVNLKSLFWLSDP